MQRQKWDVITNSIYVLPDITRDARDESVFGGDEIDVPQRRKFLTQFVNHFGDSFCCQSFESLVGLK